MTFGVATFVQCHPFKTEAVLDLRVVVGCHITDTHRMGRLTLSLALHLRQISRHDLET